MTQILLGIASFTICMTGQVFWLNKKLENNVNNIILAASNVFVIIAISSNILAVLGIYNINVVMILLLDVGILLCLANRNYLKQHEWTKGEKRSFLGLFVCLLFIFFLYSFFTIIPFGIGRDPSAYFYEAIHIAQTGGIHFDGDPFISQNYDEVKNLIDLNGAALYSAYDYQISDIPGDTVIQFLHMFPSCLATGYSLAGIKGLLLVNPILSILSLSLIFIYMKDILSVPKAAGIAFLFCALNPAQIYASRITQSEILCQFIFILSLYYYGKAHKYGSLWLFAASGILQGLMTFNRIDMYILGVGIFSLAIYYIWSCPEYTKGILLYSGSYFLMAVLSLYYGFHFSFPYFMDHWEMGVLSKIIIFDSVLFVIVLISVVVQYVFFRNKRLPDVVDFFSHNKIAIMGLASSLIILTLFAYFIRPIITVAQNDAQRFSSHSLVEFCFYTSFPAIFFAIFGLCKLIYALPTKSISFYLPWLLIGMSNLFLYIYSPSIASDQIWASRRWITICIPFILMLSAIGISNLVTKKRTFQVKIIICALTIFFMLFQTRGFLLKNIGGNIWEEYEQYSELIGDDKLYFCNNKFIVTLLREIWDKKNVYRTKTTFNESIEEYLSENGLAYYIGDLPQAIINNPNIVVTKIKNYSLNSNELERAYGRMPTKIVDVTIIADIYRLEHE